MRAPFDFEFQKVRRNPAFASFVADAFVHQLLHALDELGSCEAAPGVNRSTELSVNDIAHALQYAPQQTFRQRLLAFLFSGLVFLVSHLFGSRAPNRTRGNLSAQKTQSVLTAQ